jgi:hypothetical protein
MIQLSRRTVALALAAFLVLTAIATASLVLTLSRTADAGPGFTDTPPWIAAHAAWLRDNNIANGYSDGTFRPNDDITRGQAAFWVGNYNNTLELVSSSDTDPVTTDIAHSASCGPGKRAIAGGGQINTANLHLTDSYPLLGGWVVRFENVGTVTPVTVTITAWALCAPNTIP